LSSATSLLVAVTLGFGLVIWPYFGAIFWSVVLAIVFAPLQDWILFRLRWRRTVAALATLAAVIAGVGIPLTVVTALVVRQGSALYAALASGRIDVGASLQHAVAALPQGVLAVLDALGLRDSAAVQAKLVGSVGEASRFIASYLVRLGADSFGFALSVGVMLYLLFYLLRDGRVLAERIDAAIPLTGQDKQSLQATFVAVIRATVTGGAMMAVIQGALGGAVLAALGITGPVLWGVVFGLLSMLPAVGAGVLWLPVALYFLLTGAYVKALVLTVFGSIALTVIDNTVRPLLVGRKTHLPGSLVLISTLGGVTVFGLNGVVIGPVVAALFVATWALPLTQARSGRSHTDSE
jgi:predicted PurR-regulated permease PerM